MVLIQQIVNGLLASGIYALFAVGFTMIFGIMRVLNMAHADFGTAAAMAVVFAVTAGLTPLPVVIFCIAIILLLTVLLERTALSPGRRFRGDAAVEMPLIATIGAALIIQNVLALIFGNKVTAYPYSFRAFTRIGDLLVSKGLLLSAGAAVAILILLELLVNKTDFGRQVRAVAQNRNAAKIMGINTDLVIIATVGLSALLAGIAGNLVGVSFGFVSPYMGVAYAIKGLVAMIIGGVGSLRGAVLGAVIIGLTEAIGVNFLGSQIRDPIVFVVLMVILLLRPDGLIRGSAAR